MRWLTSADPDRVSKSASGSPGSSRSALPGDTSTPNAWHPPRRIASGEAALQRFAQFAMIATGGTLEVKRRVAAQEAQSVVATRGAASGTHPCEPALAGRERINQFELIERIERLE